MKVVLITSLYYIEGRKNLFHDTNSMHYLLKYWPKDTEILVIHTYFNRTKEITRYLDSKEREYHKNGYSYYSDHIKTEMIETQLITKQMNLTTIQANRLVKNINKKLEENNFTNPDILITQMPCRFTKQYIPKIKAKKKIAILHFADIKKTKYWKPNKKYIEQEFDSCYARSHTIREYFKKINLNNIKEEIITSGSPVVPSKNYKKTINRKKYNILYVGKLIKRKNASLVIKALKNINTNYHFTIIGEGKEYKNILNLIKKYNLENKVTMIKQLPREDVITYMEEADIFIMPSIKETLGLVYLEAMGKGCITIGTKNEGIDGIIIDGENGYLIEPNVNSIINKLEEIFTLPDKEINKIVKNALNTISNYSEEQCSINYFNIIKKEYDLLKK